MQQNLQYMKKTTEALQNLTQAAVDLETSANSEVIAQQALKETVSTLKDEIQKKAHRIDEIIQTLNGALE